MSDQPRILVTGAGGFIGHHCQLLQGARLLGRGVDLKLPEYTASFRRRVRAARPAPLGDCLQATRGRRPGLRPGRRHGRHGLHLRAPRRDPAQQLPDQPAHARGGARATASAATSTPRRPASTPSTCQSETDITPLTRGGRLPGPAAGRLRLGEAAHRAAVPALPRGVRHGDAHRRGSTTSSARSAPGDGGREKAPAAMCRKVAVAKLTAAARSRSGATASRPARFCYIDDCVEGLYRLMRVRLSPSR